MKGSFHPALSRDKSSVVPDQPLIVRHHYRVPVEEQVTAEILREQGDSIHVTLADLSVTGARIHTPEPLENLDGEFAIRVRTHPEAEHVHIPCMIRHVLGKADEGHAYGLAFASPAEPARLALENYVRERTPE